MNDDFDFWDDDDYDDYLDELGDCDTDWDDELDMENGYPDFF